MTAALDATKWRAVRMCALVGAWGVLNGFAVFILFHENTEGWLEFVIGLAAAAIASLVIEGLRERLKPAEADEEAAAKTSESERFARFLLTLVSLATFELFITAVDRAVTLFSDPRAALQLRNDMLGPSLLANAQSAPWDLVVLAILWIVAGAALSAVLAAVVFLPRSESVAQRQREGLVYGIAAGAIVAPIAVLAYVLLARVVLALDLALIHPNLWVEHVAALEPSYDVLHSVSNGYVAIGVGGWLIATRIVGPLFTSGIPGKLATVAILAVLVFVAARFKNWWWPLAIFLLVLFIAVVAPLARDLHDLATLPILAAIVWIVPGALLGTTAPLLENPSERTTLWASVAIVIGVGVAGVTFFAHQDASYYIGAAVLILAGLVLRRRDDLQTVWPVLAIAIALTISSFTLVVLHVTASFHQVLVNVAHIDSLPADIAQDPSRLIYDQIDLVGVVGGRTRRGFDDFIGQFSGLRQRSIPERNAILASARAAIRNGRNAELDLYTARERNMIARAPLVLRACRSRPGLSFDTLPGKKPVNVCLGAAPVQIATLTLAGVPAPIDGKSDVDIVALLAANQRGLDAVIARQPVPEFSYGYSLLRAVRDSEYGIFADAKRIAAYDVDLDHEKAATPIAEAAPDPPSELPLILELSIAGSVAFWITVALLAAWQMRRDAEELPATA